MMDAIPVVPTSLGFFYNFCGERLNRIQPVERVRVSSTVLYEVVENAKLILFPTGSQTWTKVKTFSEANLEFSFGLSKYVDFDVGYGCSDFDSLTQEKFLQNEYFYSFELGWYV